MRGNRDRSKMVREWRYDRVGNRVSTELGERKEGMMRRGCAEIREDARLILTPFMGPCVAIACTDTWWCYEEAESTKDVETGVWKGRTGARGEIRRCKGGEKRWGRGEGKGMKDGRIWIAERGKKGTNEAESRWRQSAKQTIPVTCGYRVFARACTAPTLLRAQGTLTQAAMTQPLSIHPARDSPATFFCLHVRQLRVLVPDSSLRRTRPASAFFFLRPTPSGAPLRHRRCLLAPRPIA
ncbi:hypothetical protein BV25DRAFT_905954 [Artomyces pyxidatus]|uniref:Uncharacterized protein n=1 Tax=Artomyces pyxidatus TaxID=48021 RepID=A0ACB8SWQ8_9AGAM|nr:hypothetical protein BV25DRAFT_905954 [Artomyces pyxidatus]